MCRLEIHFCLSRSVSMFVCLSVSLYLYIYTDETKNAQLKTFSKSNEKRYLEANKLPLAGSPLRLWTKSPLKLWTYTSAQAEMKIQTSNRLYINGVQCTRLVHQKQNYITDCKNCAPRVWVIYNIQVPNSVARL